MAESHYFWENGTKKIWCMRCRRGPFQEKSSKVKTVGFNSHICPECQRKLGINTNSKPYHEKIKDTKPKDDYKLNGQPTGIQPSKIIL